MGIPTYCSGFEGKWVISLVPTFEEMPCFCLVERQILFTGGFYDT